MIDYYVNDDESDYSSDMDYPEEECVFAEYRNRYNISQELTEHFELEHILLSTRINVLEYLAERFYNSMENDRIDDIEMLLEQGILKHLDNTKIFDFAVQSCSPYVLEQLLEYGCKTYYLNDVSIADYDYTRHYHILDILLDYKQYGNYTIELIKLLIEDNPYYIVSLLLYHKQLDKPYDENTLKYIKIGKREFYFPILYKALGDNAYSIVEFI